MHPLSLSALPAAIEENKKLVAGGLTGRVSEHLEKRLFELMSCHECIGDVRGIGHFWAIEIVKNRETEKPFNTKYEVILE